MRALRSRREHRERSPVESSCNQSRFARSTPSLHVRSSGVEAHRSQIGTNTLQLAMNFCEL